MKAVFDIVFEGGPRLGPFDRIWEGKLQNAIYAHLTPQGLEKVQALNYEVLAQGVLCIRRGGHGKTSTGEGVILRPSNSAIDGSQDEHYSTFSYIDYEIEEEVE